MEPFEILKFIFTSFGIFASLVIIIKITGIRMFGKISVIDFSAGIAIGSVLISILSSNQYSLYEGSLILATVALSQILLIVLLRKQKLFRRFFINKGKIIMWNGKILEERLRRSNMSRTDLAIKLRKANVFEFHEVKAVILENTGDISVIFNKEAIVEYQPANADSNEPTLSI